ALAVLMSITSMAACGKAKDTSGDTAAEKTAADSGSSTENVSADTGDADAPDISKEVELKWMYHGSTVTNDKEIMEKINAYLKDKINAKLKMIWCSWADFDERVQLAINGGDPIDIYFTSSWTPNNEYAAMAKKGAYVRLDNPENNLLEKYAPNLFSALHPLLAEGALTEGSEGMGIYAIPTYKEIAQQYTWDINATLLKKYGYTPDDVNDFYELGPIFEKIKQGEGKDFYPFNPEPAVLERMVNSNDYVDNTLLLTYEFDPVDPSKSGTEIKSRYETPGYKKFVEKMREYYLKGYISPEAANAKTMISNRAAKESSGQYAIGTQVYSPGHDLAASAARNIEVVCKPAQSGIISTVSTRGAMHAISVTSSDPGRALMLLNLVNTDPVLFTMLEYGIEGIHYTKEPDGRIKLNQEKRKEYTPWKAGLGKLSNLPLTTDDPANLWELFDKFNNDAKPVPILGWAFDIEPVKKEIGALANVSKEYADALNAGSVDPAVKLPEFISKLKANGIDKVVEEANRQLKAFLDAKK
ncbi:MAG: ABC transporter substrate-binding protein, partial [Bacillota bacterium]